MIAKFSANSNVSVLNRVKSRLYGIENDAEY
jgi:hypothetical protein